MECTSIRHTGIERDGEFYYGDVGSDAECLQFKYGQIPEAMQGRRRDCLFNLWADYGIGPMRMPVREERDD